MLRDDNADQSIRWRPGERLSHLFEQRCDALAARGLQDRPAIEASDGALTFAGLDRLANQLARVFAARGLEPGMRVGLLLDKSYTAYAALLAAIKLDVTFVPVDASFPRDRLAYIASDAELGAIVVSQRYRDRVEGIVSSLITIDGSLLDAARALPDRRRPVQRPDADDTAYIVYTSGSTGRPKGVAVGHSSICNFVRVAGDVYGLREGDRVYQGMTLAFDFSTEELWVPLIVGATVVAAPSDTTLVGRDLAHFLVESRVTGLCCVPTLLATITEDLPGLRFLLVSGEACPQDLVNRWHRPGRRMLNAYGPTEATVTASWTELEPGRPVTIGRPLPTYTMLILGADGRSEMPPGIAGEIAIGGIGLAKGYVNRPEQTERAFIPDFAAVPDNPSGRLYRTGDLGRINEDGEIEYLGRIDTQVKLRGYRIELTEIESAVLESPSVAQAVARLWSANGASQEIAVYITRRSDVHAVDPSTIAAHLKTRLPGYMIPAYIEEVPSIPMLASGKADRDRLPEPIAPRLIASRATFVSPRTETERLISGILAGVLGLEAISVTDDFFADLGGHSLLMTEFVFALQDRLHDDRVSIRDVYLNPTVEKLARTLDNASPGTAPRVAPPVVPSTAGPSATRLEHLTCGVLQYAFYVALSLIYVVIGLATYRRMTDAEGPVALYLAALEGALALATMAFALPVAAKWLLIGRFTERRIRIWSLDYVRFWIVKQLVQTSPVVLFRGQPLYNLYLRLLGAKIGTGASIGTRFAPVCCDLLTVGARAVIAKDALVQTYRAESGFILTGRVNIGNDAIVGEGSVVDIATSIGNGADLAHASSLHPGQSIPDDCSYWGSPAVPAPSRRPRVPDLPTSAMRGTLYTLVICLSLIGVLMPALEIAASAAAAWIGTVVAFATAQLLTAGFAAPLASALASLAVSLGLFSIGTVASVTVSALLARGLAQLLPAGRVYPLYGVRYVVASFVSWVSNSYFHNVLFGDSSFIVTYLRAIGFDLAAVRQTGSNFGSHQRHDIPTACGVGSGTMVSDGLSMINLRQSSTGFVIERAVIPERSFLGNHIICVPGARLGPGNLLATKVHLPLSGAIREGVGLLGSPPFEIPRTIVTARSFDPFATTPASKQRLAAKDRHNLVTVAWYLLMIWGSGVLTLAIAGASIAGFAVFGWPAIVCGAALAPGFAVLYFVAAERLGPGRMHLEPHTCTIHDLHFWRIERYWKMGETPLKVSFKGTPLRPWIYRMLGVRVGRMVFDDGCNITEKGLTEIGENACLNELSSLQSHSLEDGLFKSDVIRIGAGCTLGVNAFVNYGTRMGADAVLAADSFLMKGSIVPAGHVWAGNPARPLTTEGGHGLGEPARAVDA